MSTQRLWQGLVLHAFIVVMIALFSIPLYLALIAASNEAATLMQGSAPFLPGRQLWVNVKAVLLHGVAGTDGVPVALMLFNSLLMALLIAVGKIILALFSAFALVYCAFPAKKLAFALIFATMMLPVEVRIVPTFQVVAAFGWMNTYAGLSLPLMASATATFLFRQFFNTIPNDLVNAAKLDGAGPLRFFFHILLPMSKTPLAALFVILFVYGWNQYLWPLVITTDSNYSTIVMGIRYLAGVADQIPQWHYIMTVALIALIPPVLVVLLLQRWFERGLIH
ncbi:MAG: sn-glycerol-3-phosphate ABC transporter permease UgpE [Legionellaceae bacterium]|nr:sn-glycerol-3-phosphate ABC transporter permease UgpE [Legionellaceae bacterium]